MTTYNFFEIIITDRSEEHTLTYKIYEHSAAQKLAKHIAESTVSELRPTMDPWKGLLYDRDEKVKELKNLIEYLNSWLVYKIEAKWTDEDPLRSLCHLHTHFVDEPKSNLTKERHDSLIKFNDLIHELEFLFRKNKEYFHLHLVINNALRKTNIDREEFKLFATDTKFGDLVIHYCHTGRSPWEIFSMNDILCPPEQIVPQWQIAFNFKLYFYSKLSDPEKDLERFRDFYYTSGIKWPYELDDPRLALGHIPAGKLVFLNGKTEDEKIIYQTVKRCNTIKDWKIY